MSGQPDGDLDGPDERPISKILRATAVIGGAQAVGLVTGMIRVKFSALLIGPAGVGLIGNFQAIQGLVSTISGLGVSSSGVREVASAVASNDNLAVVRACIALRRVAWLTGFAGAAAMLALSSVLSEVTFGTRQYATEVAWLSIAVLFTSIYGSHIALIQGFRKIRELARVQIVTAILGSSASVVMYFAFGIEGIIPSLLAIAAVQFAASSYTARGFEGLNAHVSWRDTFGAARHLIVLGAYFMGATLVNTFVAYATRVLITQREGLDSLGIFSAAYSLSAMFVTFILGAMAADYYPRLTASAHDHRRMNQIVNDQTEVGVLLAVPGLLATLSLAPWVIRAFYSKEFEPAAEVLQWFVLGCLGRVICWPFEYVLLAIGKSGLWFVTMLAFNILHMGLNIFGLWLFGIQGVGMAFFALYVVGFGVMYFVCTRLTDFTFTWSANVLLVRFIPLLAAAFAIERFLPGWPALGLGLLLTCVGGIMCLRGIVSRVGPEHNIVQVLWRIPGLRWVSGG